MKIGFILGNKILNKLLNVAKKSVDVRNFHLKNK